MPALKAIFLLFLAAQLQAQTQTSIHPGLTGEDLLTQLVTDYKTTTVLDYGPARDLLYGTIDIKNDSVSGIYSGHRLYLPADVDPSSHLYMGGIADGINAEHTYPRSKGARDGNGFSDMHHLFPCRVAVNTSRNNFPFADINDRQTTSWFYLNQSQSSTPTTNIDLYSERINGAFEPRESKKGDIARAMIYFFTMYKEEALAADPNFFEEQRETFCRWHRQDPVDVTEWERTFMIAAHQDDLPNPFILDSTLVRRAYCDALTAVSEQVDATVQVYPNPVVDVLYVVVPGRNMVSVTNSKGQVLIELLFNDKAEIDFSKIVSGTYFVRVGKEGYQVVKN